MGKRSQLEPDDRVNGEGKPKKRRVDSEVTSETPALPLAVNLQPQEEPGKSKKSRKHHDGSNITNDGSRNSEADVSAALEHDRPETKQERKERKRARKQEKLRLQEVSTSKNSLNGTLTFPPGRGDVKQRYTQHPDMTKLSENRVNSFLASNSINITEAGTEKYRPVMDFNHISPSPEETNMFKNFTSPTPIQAATWPYLLAGRDVVGVAETGSGKTLAFGLPLVRQIKAHMKTSDRGIKALVVGPTRELAIQIHEQLEQLVNGTGIKTVCVYGGTPKDGQRAALKAARIVVGTPGRLNDFIQEGSADLSRVDLVVLDEADRMLEKGFEEEVRKIVGAVSTKERQTAMFTATWPPSIRDLAATFMSNPVKATIGEASGDLRANVRVEQKVEVLDPRGKEDRLLQLLNQYHRGKGKDDRVLVFCLYKKEASRIERYVRSRGFHVSGIHGDMNQQARLESLEGFRSGKVPLLVATDVAARGLDIPAVKLVINLTFPLTVEDYVHRIGRTGRAGKEGLAITLFTEHEKTLSGALINVLRAAKQPVPEELLKFGTTVKKKTHEVYGAFYRDISEDGAKPTKITFE